MKTHLIFSTIVSDTVIIPPGLYEAGTAFPVFDADSDTELSEISLITKQIETETVRWLIKSNAARRLLLNELNLFGEIYYKIEVGKPIITNANKKPGDIDLLLCTANEPDRSVAIQTKCVKVKTLEQKDKNGVVKDIVNKVDGLGNIVQQVNGQRSNFGFHRNYAMIIMLADGRAKTRQNILCSGPNRETLQKVYDFPRRDNLHEECGIIFVEITQPTNRDYNLKSVIGVCIDKEAARLEQTNDLTNKIKDLMQP